MSSYPQLLFSNLCFSSSLSTRTSFCGPGLFFFQQRVLFSSSSSSLAQAILVIVHLWFAKHNSSLLSYRWCECRVAPVTHKGWTPPTSRPAPLIMRTGMQSGEAQKIMENENEDDKDKEEREAEKGKEKEKEKQKGKDKPRERLINITKEDLWALQRVLDSRKSSLSSTYTRNSGANKKVHDLNQKPCRHWTAWPTCTRRSRTRGPLWRRNPPKVTCCLLKRKEQFINLRRLGSTRHAFWMSRRALAKERLKGIEQLPSSSRCSVGRPGGRELADYRSKEKGR